MGYFDARDRVPVQPLAMLHVAHTARVCTRAQEESLA